MLDNDIVRLASVKSGGKFLHPLPCLSGIYGIHHRYLLAKDKIAVVTHPLRDEILAFEQVNLPVVNAYEFHCFIFHSAKILFSDQIRSRYGLRSLNIVFVELEYHKARIILGIRLPLPSLRAVRIGILGEI